MPSKGSELATKLFLLLVSSFALVTSLSADALVHDVLIVKLAEDQPARESQGPVSLRMSPSLKEKASCQLDIAHPSVDHECPGAVPKRLLKYYQSPVRIIGRSLGTQIGIKSLLDLCSRIRLTYDASEEKKLASIIVMLPTNLAAPLDLFLEDFDVPVVLIDTAKIFHEISIYSGNLKKKKTN